jgi:hypothetical protein
MNHFRFTIHADNETAQTRHTYKGGAVSQFKGGKALAGTLHRLLDENPPLQEADKVTVTFTLKQPKKP